MTTYLADRITVDPEVCHGKPTIRGSRLMVKTVVEYLAAGDTTAEILTYHSWLTPEDVAVCAHSAVALMDNQYPIKYRAQMNRTMWVRSSTTALGGPFSFSKTL